MQGYDPYNSYPTNSVPNDYAQTAQNRGLAIASLAVGIISCFTLGLGGIGTIAGIVLGVLALNRARRDPVHYGGRGLAIAGISTSILSAVIAVGVIVAVTRTVPQMMANIKMNQNENRALVRMRGIVRSEKSYRVYVIPGKYATLEELHSRGLIEHGADADGYRYNVRTTANSFEATATPEEYGVSGRISFYVAADGVIHMADHRGAEASASDPTARGISAR